MKVSFTNTSDETSYYLRGSRLCEFVEKGYYEAVEEYRDDCAPIYLGMGQTVYRDFIFERSYLENNSYMLDLMLKINDTNIDGVCGYVVFQYEADQRPLVSDVSARAMRADMEVKASDITVDDQTVRFQVSFENLSEDTSLYYNGNCVLGKIVSQGHDKRIEWQDGGAPFFMGQTAVSRVFVIDRDLLQDGQYRLHIFFALESGDLNIENAPCAEVLFELQNFE